MKKMFNAMSTNELYKFYRECIDINRYPTFKNFITDLLVNYSISKRHPASIRYTVSRVKMF